MASGAAAGLVEELHSFVADGWGGEPEDVRRLRSFSLPPMGNLPCVLYCNFDLFWAGEQLQVVRNAALAGELTPHELARVASLLLERTAARTAKWEMEQTVAMIRRAAATLRDWEPGSAAELALVLEQLLVAINRVQAAVDAIVPWNDLDGRVGLRAPLR